MKEYIQSYLYQDSKVLNLSTFFGQCPPPHFRAASPVPCIMCVNFFKILILGQKLPKLLLQTSNSSWILNLVFSVEIDLKMLNYLY